jgi:hypothetical protein
MDITKEQIEQAKRGQAVEVADNGDEFVLVRKDMFDRVRGVIEEWDPRDAYPLVNNVMRDDDADDPLLDTYQRRRSGTGF